MDERWAGGLFGQLPDARFLDGAPGDWPPPLQGHDGGMVAADSNILHGQRVRAFLKRSSAGGRGETHYLLARRRRWHGPLGFGDHRVLAGCRQVVADER